MCASSGGAIGERRGLERRYLQAGRSRELTPLYNDVLAKLQDARPAEAEVRRMAAAPWRRRDAAPSRCPLRSRQPASNRHVNSHDLRDGHGYLAGSGFAFDRLGPLP